MAALSPLVASGSLMPRKYVRSSGSVHCPLRSLSAHVSAWRSPVDMGAAHISAFCSLSGWSRARMYASRGNTASRSATARGSFQCHSNSLTERYCMASICARSPPSGCTRIQCSPNLCSTDTVYPPVTRPTQMLQHPLELAEHRHAQPRRIPADAEHLRHDVERARRLRQVDFHQPADVRGEHRRHADQDEAHDLARHPVHRRLHAQVAMADGENE